MPMTSEQQPFFLAMLKGECANCTGNGYWYDGDGGKHQCEACEGTSRMPLLPEKFIANIQPGPNEGDCWLWLGWKTGNGYGRYRPSRKGAKLAHRMVYEALNGPIPDDLQVDHICGRRDCVHPKHLRLLTNRDNGLRGTSALYGTWLGRLKTHCKHGHLFSEANTWYTKEGWRQCRTCHREREAKRQRTLAINAPEAWEWCRENIKGD